MEGKKTDYHKELERIITKSKDVDPPRIESDTPHLAASEASDPQVAVHVDGHSVRHLVLEAGALVVQQDALVTWEEGTVSGRERAWVEGRGCGLVC